MKKKTIVSTLSTLALTGILLGIVTAPVMAAKGDFYDTTTNVHYSVAGLTGASKSNLIAAYARGDSFLKEEGGGKFLDYNSAYALLASKIAAGFSATDAISAVAADPTLQKTIDITKFTDASSVTVSSANSIQETTPAGTIPALPSTVSVTMSDGTNMTVNVTWDAIDPSKYAVAGAIFTVNGTIAESTTVKVTATITVTDDLITVISID
jgi:hypothetical protein